MPVEEKGFPLHHKTHNLHEIHTQSSLLLRAEILRKIVTRELTHCDNETKRDNVA